MLKKMGLRKILLTTSALFVIGLLYIFPTKNVKVNRSINYVNEENLLCIYLLDKNSYVSEVDVVVNESELEKKLIEKLTIMTVDSDMSNKIPKEFKSIIPSNTKVNSLKIENDTVTVDFSKDLLGISSILEEKMIEAIVFTLTSEEGIDKVIIKVDGSVLERLPNSNKLLPEILDRSFGINKDYDINNIYGLTKTTIYYIGNSNDVEYYVPVTKINNSNDEKVNIIVNELKSSILYQSNLSSYLNSKVELQKYEKEKEVMNLTFNDKIFDNIYDNNILEEVVYTIGRSVIDSYEDVSEVVFNVNDKEILKFNK